MVTTLAGQQGSWLIGQETGHVPVTMGMTAMKVTGGGSAYAVVWLRDRNHMVQERRHARGHVQGPDTLVATAAYQPEPTAAAAARRFVRDTLQTWLISGAAADGHGFVDDAVLLTSELVTNAVVHAGTAVEVTCKLTEGGVEVVVSDGHPARLVPEPPENEHIPAERTSGRGLLLPAALASAWGVTYGRAAKAVWFRIGQPGPGLGAGSGGRPDGLGAVLDTGPQDGAGKPVDGSAALAAALRRAPAATQPADRSEVPHTNGSHRWPVRSLGDPGYGELLASTVESACTTVGADAAYALMADEDGDLSLRAATGRFLAQAADQEWPDTAGQAVMGGASLAAARAAAGAAPSLVTVPFVVDGRVTGLLAVAAATLGRFRDDQAARLQQLADRCGPPLERARLSELERVRRGRIGALAQVRGLLAGSFDQAEVMAVAGQAAVPRLVPWCAVLLPGPAPSGAGVPRPGGPGAEAGLRTAYARHVDEARSGALAWLLDRACEGAQRSGPAPRAPTHGPAWRWSLAVPGLAKAPAGASELAGDTAWCFPLARDSGTGVFAVGHHRDERLPREVVELAADLACRIGVALQNARLVSQGG
jgi:anti-sigma regulatory factor (Ser/Thr protein kinase)